MSPFEECRSRINRAHGHCKAFVAGWKSLLESDSYSFSAEMKDERTWVVKAALLVPVRSELSLELGEFFYQLRAALNGAVYQTAEMIGSKNSSNENRWEFPIYAKPNDFRNSALCKWDFPDQLRDWIESIQPYNAEKLIGLPDEWVCAALQLLNECARKDRHRRLHLVAAVPITHIGTVVVPSPAKVTSVMSIPANLLDSESEFLRFTADGLITGTDIDLKGKFTIEVSVDEIPGSVGENVLKTLIHIEGVTKLVIERFEDAFK
jgi:hypothetical protein